MASSICRKTKQRSVQTVDVVDGEPGTRFMLMTGKPFGERPVYNGPYVD